MVVVDSAGNVIITGSSAGSGTGQDFYTAKYAAAGGALLWERRYNAPANGDDTVNSMVLDSRGNVIVSGRSTGSGGGEDIYTAMYAAADGALLWEKQYNGTGNLNDASAGVTVDHDGGIIVSAVTNFGSDSDSSSADIYTVKYVLADGDGDGLLDAWEIEHFGNTAGQSALDDTDGDGSGELLELAFGTDPKSPASVPAPAVVNEGGYLTTTITKQTCVRYLVETGATLESGFSATNTTVLTDDATTLKVRDNVLIGSQPARFLRVQVIAAP